MSKSWWYRILEAIIFGTLATYWGLSPASWGFWVLVSGCLAISVSAEERGKLAARKRGF